MGMHVYVMLRTACQKQASNETNETVCKVKGGSSTACLGKTRRNKQVSSLALSEKDMQQGVCLEPSMRSCTVPSFDLKVTHCVTLSVSEFGLTATRAVTIIVTAYAAAYNSALSLISPVLAL